MSSIEAAGKAADKTSGPTGFVYCNGMVLTAASAKVSAFDHGFLYGHGLFETMRVYDGQVFAWERHMQRLQAGAKVLSWPQLPPVADLAEAVQELLAVNGLRQASVRLALTRGEGVARPEPSVCGEPTVFIITSPLSLPTAAVYAQGWQLITANLRRNAASPLCRLKSANYLENILAKQQARQAGAAEALLLNNAGYVAEGTMSNIFLLQGEEMCTPDLDSGLLPGITREIVLALGKELGLKVRQAQIQPAELLQAEEVFLTSSLLELMPVTSLDGSIIGCGCAGAGVKKLQQAYSETVAAYVVDRQAGKKSDKT